MQGLGGGWEGLGGGISRTLLLLLLLLVVVVAVVVVVVVVIVVVAVLDVTLARIINSAIKGQALEEECFRQKTQKQTKLGTHVYHS